MEILDRRINILKEAIEARLTGNVTVEKDTEAKVVTYHWVKNDHTVHKESMSYRFSFAEIEQTYFVVDLAAQFVTAYKKSKEFFKPEEVVTEEIVEEKPKKVSRKKVVVEDGGELVAPPYEADERS